MLAAADSATEPLRRELKATLFKLQAQSEATAQAHETIRELQQEIANLRAEATARVAEQEVLMQAVAESAHEHTQREIAAMQEHIEQLQTALSTSRSEAQQARVENERLVAQMATTRQLLVVAETEVHELRRQLGEKLKVDRKEARETHQDYCSEVRRAMRAEIELEKETVKQLQAGNLQAVIQLQAKKKALRRRNVDADGAVPVGSTTEKGEDGVMLPAQLRRELGTTRAQLASVTQALEVVAQGGPAEEVKGCRAGASDNSSSMGLRSSRRSLQMAAPVGNLADELVDIYSRYHIPAMPKYEFSTLS